MQTWLQESDGVYKSEDAPYWRFSIRPHFRDETRVARPPYLAIGMILLVALLSHTLTHANTPTESLCAACTLTHPLLLLLLLPWRHVQGSRDHPECFALHCLALPFSACEGGGGRGGEVGRGGRRALCQEMGQALSLPASFFHPGLCLPGQLFLSCPPNVSVSLNACVCECVHM